MKRFPGFLAVLIVCCSAGTALADDVATLIKQLESKDSDVRRAAVKSLAAKKKEAGSAAPALVKALKEDRDLYVRRFAAQALGEIGADPAVAGPALTEAARSNRREIADAALTSLGKLGPGAVPALVEVLKKREVRGGKPKGKSREPVHDASATLRAKAAQALGNLGPDAREAVPALIEALQDPDVRTDAATALGNIGPDAKEAISALTEISQNKSGKKDKSFQAAVKEALTKIRKGK